MPALGELSGIIGKSPEVERMLATLARIAPKPSTVLIKGETGTGKELVAHALHQLSERSGRFVPVNCGAISPELIEGELFGHVRGAFTGAHQPRDGLFKLADRGTLFLDEIGEMPLALQAKLLRVLEERRFRPVGGNLEQVVDTRVVAATNRDLLSAVHRGHFREDLYYRINIVDLRLPPLRERRHDIPVLARFFNETLAAQLGVAPLTLTSQDLHQLVSYDWPGNCRELRNLIERSLLLGQTPSHCCAELGAGADGAHQAPCSEEGPLRESRASLRDLERDHILNALLAARGNKTAAARNLGVSRKTIERKLKQWGAAGAIPSPTLAGGRS